MRNRLDKWWRKPERGPLKRGRRRPAPLVDIFTPEWIYIWLVVDGWNFEEAGEETVGVCPEWYQRDVIESGWDSILGATSWSSGWSRELLWCFEEGIAPGQPFQVFLPQPRWYRCSYEYEEYDCEYEPEIVRLAPMHPSLVLKKLAQAVADEKSDREYMAKRNAELDFLRRTQVKDMHLHVDVYFGRGQSSWDDMCMPSGIRYNLCSTASLDKTRYSCNLVSGEDDDGSHEVALNNLVKNAIERLPGLAEETIRALPRRSW